MLPGDEKSGSLNIYFVENIFDQKDMVLKGEGLNGLW